MFPTFSDVRRRNSDTYAAVCTLTIRYMLQCYYYYNYYYYYYY
jgi:hypothetical protein